MTASQTTVSEHGARIAASRLRITVEEYRQHEAAGEHWCPRCESWVPQARFHVTCGRAGYCVPCRQSSDTGLDVDARVSLTPEGAAVKSRQGLPADAGVVSPDAYPGTAVPSGHIYRPVEYLRPMQAARLERMRALLGVPVGAVVRVEVSHGPQ